jgi:hypothetical protein
VVYLWKVPPLVANQFDLFMHFLGASRDGLVARRVDLNTISSSAKSQRPVVMDKLSSSDLITHDRCEWNDI